ncbi:MAG TPA: metallophosphoesterase, partial [Polyangiaceae bacterium]
DPESNFGIIIANSSNTDGMSLYSSEYSTITARPMLSVTYRGQQTTTDPIPVDSAGNSPRYGLFVYSDSHVDAATSPAFSTALAQMAELQNVAGAPRIIATMSLGDHTESGLDASWDAHMGITGPYWDAAATEFGGTSPRYIAVPGNHDVMAGSSWYDIWNDHLPGQVALAGNSSSAGVYFNFTHENALLVGLDTNRATNSSTSYVNDPQIQMLRSMLSGSTSPFKFMFYHMPAFYCSSSGGGPTPAALAFVDLAAQYNVDTIFNGHSHVYTRTCRMTKSHTCTGTASGTVQVEVGSVGTADARLRALRTTAQSVTGYDASGVSSTISYACSAAGGYVTTLDAQRTFCYVNVRGCWANVKCYRVGNTTPFDSWTLNHCQ